jgi:RNA polymerase sigma factor (sigma-70 family)
MAAGESGSAEARDALERLCRAYWYPLYAYIRRRGRTAHDAQDLTQAFFLQLLEHGYLARADPRKGRFRAFLLVALNHFMANEWHRAHALKRGGDVAFLSWDESAEERYETDGVLTDNPERVFEQRWAIAVVDHAVNQLRQEFAGAGRSAVFDTLKAVLTGDRACEPYAAVGERLGMTEAAVKMTVVRMRRRFAEILRKEVGDTVADADDVNDELRHLLAVLAGTNRG